MASRMRHIDELYGILAERLRHKTTAQWTGIFTARDVSFGPVNSLDDLMQDEYLRETGFFKRYQHPTEGEVVMTSIPVNFSASPGSYRLPPPRVGEHTQEILESIGFKEGQQRHE